MVTVEGITDIYTNGLAFLAINKNTGLGQLGPQKIFLGFWGFSKLKTPPLRMVSFWLPLNHHQIWSVFAGKPK